MLIHSFLFKTNSRPLVPSRNASYTSSTPTAVPRDESNNGCCDCNRGEPNLLERSPAVGIGHNPPMMTLGIASQ